MATSLLVASVQIDYFQLSYAITWLLAAIPAVVLHKVMQETIWLSRKRDELKGRKRNVPTGPIPEFTAERLDDGGVVSSKDLVGTETVLMFVHPDDADLETTKYLQTSAHALMHKAKGKIYMVCSGTAAQCQRVAPSVVFGAEQPFPIPILIDEDGSIATAFQVKRTPVAFRLGAQAEIVGYGSLVGRSKA